jgi:steroid delta-isomerase-like uncharacterized protein
MSFPEQKRIAQEFIDELFNKQNINEINRLVTPDILYHALFEDISGMEKVKEWISADYSIFPDMQFTIVNSIAEKDKVCLCWIVEGTLEKEFHGIQPSHKKFDTVGISIFHFVGSKIKEVWVVVDSLTPLLEMGVVKAVSP